MPKKEDLNALLDTFALAAMNGFLSGKHLSENYFTETSDYKIIAKQSYRLALAMIKERAEVRGLC